LSLGLTPVSPTDKTGGAGANYVGIGADVKYRQDILRMGLRVVSVQTAVRPAIDLAFTQR